MTPLAARRGAPSSRGTRDASDGSGAPGRLGQRLGRLWRPGSLLTRFTVTGLLLTVMIGLVLGTLVGRQLEKAALAHEAERTAQTVGSEIDPFLQPEDFSAVPSPERAQAIDRHIRERVRDRHIVKIKIWNPDGTVVYSTDRSVIGRRFAIEDELAEALRGEIAMDITTLSKDENRAESRRYARLMEIYVPIRRGDGRVAGAYEVYLDVQTLTPMIAATQRFLWIGLALGLSGLYVALFGVVSRASRRLHRQSEELAGLEARRIVDRFTTELVSVVSHELRTPLTALVGFSELLLTTSGDEAEQREWVEHMHAAAKRLTTLVEDLLDVSRIEEGRLELRRQPVDVRAAVNLALADFRRHASGHRFEERYLEPLPPLLADPDKLTQVLTNLISNAIKYSPMGGPVTISARAAGATVSLSVADQGLGLPPGELPRIFERFHRIQDEARRQIPGTGLGLYITRRLVELHDGRIWAESAGPGGGSTFHVELPAAGVGNGHG
jgi:signal transduction histidine kinase